MGVLGLKPLIKRGASYKQLTFIITFLWSMIAMLQFHEDGKILYENMSIAFIALVFIAWGIEIRKDSKKKYVPCPECNLSVKIIEAWKCDKCFNTQPKEIPITDNCHFCERKLTSVFCEHCHKELGL